MELWIRSQDKKILQKVNKLYVATYSEEVGYGIYDLRYDDLEDIDDCDILLGFYKSKERALEVLDEIQNILKPHLIIKNSGKIIGAFEDTIIREGATYETKELTTYVYEMPKE